MLACKTIPVASFLSGLVSLSPAQPTHTLAPFPPLLVPLLQEVDKVELIYTKFVSLISGSPVIQTLLPLSPSGEVCDINGNCVDAAEDEVFKLTTREGQLVVESEQVRQSGGREFQGSGGRGSGGWLAGWFAVAGGRAG